jgi:hypothetical protein
MTKKKPDQKQFLAQSLVGRSGVCGLLLTGIVVVTVALNTRVIHLGYSAIWVATMLLTVLAMMVIGAGVNGRVQGILIDDRNLVSLSKFQMAVWTVIVISSLAVAAAFNQANGDQSAAIAAWKASGAPGALPLPWGPLDITIPQELLFAMGIAGTSFIATPSLLSLRSGDEPAAGTLSAATDALGLDDGQTKAQGKIFGLMQPDLASWADMFRGDEVGNAASADISKVQQFLITVLLASVYCSAAWSLFSDADAQLAVHGTRAVALIALPSLSGGFIVLMGISHAGYLAYKLVPHTPSADDTPAPAGTDDGAAG